VRQEQIGEWHSVVDAMAERLTEIASGARARAEALPLVHRFSRFAERAAAPQAT
jgi:hypothetical protein